MVEQRKVVCYYESNLKPAEKWQEKTRNCWRVTLKSEPWEWNYIVWAQIESDWEESRQTLPLLCPDFHEDQLEQWRTRKNCRRTLQNEIRQAVKCNFITLAQISSNDMESGCKWCCVSSIKQKINNDIFYWHYLLVQISVSPQPHGKVRVLTAARHCRGLKADIFQSDWGSWQSKNPHSKK